MNMIINFDAQIYWSWFNPIQDGGAKRPLYQFFPYNFYKRRN